MYIHSENVFHPPWRRLPAGITGDPLGGQGGQGGSAGRGAEHRTLVYPLQPFSPPLSCSLSQEGEPGQESHHYL